MDDAGVVEEWVYQGGTFTSTNSWMQGGSGSGGNKILEWNTDFKTTREQILLKERKSGIIITYNHPTIGWIEEQFVGGAAFTADGIFGNNQYWRVSKDYSNYVRYDVTDRIKQSGYVGSSGQIITSNVWRYNEDIIKVNKGEIIEYKGAVNASVLFLSIWSEDGSFIKGFNNKDNSIYIAEGDCYVRFSFGIAENNVAFIFRSINQVIEENIEPTKELINKNRDNVFSFQLQSYNLIKESNIERRDKTKSLWCRIDTSGMKALQLYNYIFNGIYSPYIDGDYQSKTNIGDYAIECYNSDDSKISTSYAINSVFYILPENCAYIIWKLYVTSETDTTLTIKENYKYAVAFNVDAIPYICQIYYNKTWINSLTDASGENKNNLFNYNHNTIGYGFYNNGVREGKYECMSEYIRVKGNTKYFLGFDEKTNLYFKPYSNIRYNISVSYLDEEFTFLSTEQFVWADKCKVITTPEAAKYIVLGFGANESESLYFTKSVAFNYAIRGLILSEYVEKSEIDNLFDGIAKTGYINQNGQYFTTTGYGVTDYLEAEENTEYILDISDFKAEYIPGNIAYIGFYGENKVPIGNAVKMYYSFGLSYIISKVRFTTPIGTKYIAFTLYQNSAQNISNVTLTKVKSRINIFNRFDNKSDALFYMTDYYQKYSAYANILIDKNVLAFGDSITTYPWLECVAQILPMKFLKRYGNSGGTYAMGKGLAGRDIIQMVEQAISEYESGTIEKPDVIFLFGGINDTSNYFPGDVKTAWEAETLTDELKQTTAGALRYIFELIWEKWLGVDIYLMTPYQNPSLTFNGTYTRQQSVERNMTINNIIRETSRYANCKLIDCFRLVPINMFEEKNRIGTYLIQDSGLIHPSIGGIVAISKCVANEYIRYNCIQPNDDHFNVTFL